MNTELSGKIVVITGASGGIGSATARAFAAEGARLALLCHQGKDRARALAESLGPAESLVVAADLRRESAVRRAFASVIRRFGGIDVLVANAGAWETRDVPVRHMTLKQWDATLRSVLTSTFLCVKAFLARVEDQRRGTVVLIGSTAAVFGEAGHADYAAAKAGMAYGFTRTLKNEIVRLAPRTRNYGGGRVNCVCPGWTVVPRTAPKLADPKVVRRVTSTMALPKVARPEDIANAIVFLASDRLAGHVTGQTLVVAGGMEGRMVWEPDELDPGLA